MPELVHEWRHDGRITTFTWLGRNDATPDRVYALACTATQELLLVTDEGTAPSCWLPGGGIEPGETPEAALRRELKEEANAEVLAMAEIGVQVAEDPVDGCSTQAFYWCRVRLGEDFHPAHEVTQRRLVDADAFLDVLFWGRDDPKARFLLDSALEMDRGYESCDGA